MRVWWIAVAQGGSHPGEFVVGGGLVPAIGWKLDPIWDYWPQRLIVGCAEPLIGYEHPGWIGPIGQICHAWGWTGGHRVHMDPR